jgi:hypothetical protein
MNIPHFRIEAIAIFLALLPGATEAQSLDLNPGEKWINIRDVQSLDHTIGSVLIVTRGSKLIGTMSTREKIENPAFPVTERKFFASYKLSTSLNCEPEGITGSPENPLFVRISNGAGNIKECLLSKDNSCAYLDRVSKIILENVDQRKPSPFTDEYSLLGCH